MRRILKCEWKKTAVNEWSLRDAHDSTHARVVLDYQRPAKMFIVYTMHTEGNDGFETLRGAQRRAEQRLWDLWDALAPAFGVDTSAKKEPAVCQDCQQPLERIPADGACAWCVNPKCGACHRSRRAPKA